ncbi:MAG: FlgD immunoglobulin-like domain containing protein [Candidatus Tenebribacter davisii]|nr:FlgD immunoglobulin-like domain containing protein [Candidatus Tenebribacter davisii]
MNYLYGSNADFGIDILDANDGVPFMYSQDDAVRGVYYDSGNYRTIAASSFFGALADGSAGNTKADVMAQYLEFLVGDLSPNIVASTDQIDFGIVTTNNLQINNLEITNLGYETLQISDVVISGEGFNYNGVLQFDLEHLQIYVLEIEFETAQMGQYSGELTILSNDPDTQELVIPLNAECLTSIDDDLAVADQLLSNYPNPFNPSTTISFTLSTDSTENTELVIYNIKGQIVKQLLREHLAEGKYSVVWNGKDDRGKSVSSGIYYYRLSSGNFQQARKMILMK